MTIGGITIDRTNGIIGRDTNNNTKFTVDPNTGILTAVDGIFTGQVNATSGIIGNFTLTTANDQDGAGQLRTAGMLLRGDSLSFFGSVANSTLLNGSRLSVIDEIGPGVQGSTTYGSSLINAPSLLRIRAENFLSLHSFNSFVFASSGATPSTANAAKITVGTGGVSTKIVKTNIEDLNYTEVDSFLSLMAPKKFTNMLKNKEKISLIIEDEEDKNLPFKEMLFKREEGLYMFKELPPYLLDYIDDEEVIKKEYDGYGEISHYYFSPKVIDEQTIQGLMLASIKYNHQRIKQLETENENLKSEIAAIKAFVGMDG